MSDTCGVAHQANIPEAPHHSDPHRSSTYWRHCPTIMAEALAGGHRMVAGVQRQGAHRDYNGPRALEP